MTEEQKRAAIGALTNSESAIVSDRPLVAEQWADSAAQMIRDANLSTRDVAPIDGSTTGDKIAITLSASVLVWMLVSMLFGVWTL